MTTWLRPIEQMVIASTRERRVIGITAPHAGAGVSTVSNAFAEISARWGAKTLLIDMSQEMTQESGGRRWAPGLGDPRLFLETSDRSYDLLQAVPSPASLGAFSSAKHFRECLVCDLADYGAIVLDLPSVLGFTLDTVNPLIAALSCDAVIVVCAKGRTTADHLKQTVQALTLAGSVVAGTVLNETDRKGRSGARRTA